MFDSAPAQNVDDSTADDRVQFDSAELDRFTGVLRRLALPYRVSGSSTTVNTSINKSVDAATGAISTVLDLAKFDSAIDGAVLLHRESMATMWSNQSGMPTGLGWFVQNYNGQKVVWQFGNTPGGYSSLILKVPGPSPDADPARQQRRPQCAVFAPGRRRHFFTLRQDVPPPVHWLARTGLCRLWDDAESSRMPPDYFS
jgi:hypothetical protein